ncbi:kinase-like domain-containing protein [Trametes meyenii]|nr:kinase-like domain-containing protein [Trametes meyenii]
MREWVFYAVLGMIADTVDTILTIIRPLKRPQISLTPSDIDHLSDEELLELGKTAPRLHPDANVKKLSSGTVAKPSQDRDEEATNPSEANALNLVFASTTVPVPRIRRVVKRQWDFLIVMDYIEGPTLARLWPTLSTWRKLLAAFILRRYIRQLRRCLKAPAEASPGPLCADGSARICESPVFGQVQSDRGPFASYAELSAFFNERHRMALDIKNVSQDDPARADLFDDSEPLVLTHQDINLRNVVVDKEGLLWLIDWAWAGYYPVWFEYAAMQRQSRDPVISGTDDKLWKAMIPFICGPYFKQDRWLMRMGLALYYV